MDHILSPMSVVEWVWAIAAKFSERPDTKQHGQDAEASFNEELNKFKAMISGHAGEQKTKLEKYHVLLVASMDRTLRNLETYQIYRNDRFKEIENIKQEKQNSVDQIKSLTIGFQTAFPKLASSTAIGGVSGLSLTNFLSQFQLNDLQKDVIILTFLGIGYLITDFVVVPIKIRVDENTINQCNLKEKDVYDKYLQRSKSELERLFATLKAGYNEAMGKPYPKHVIDGKEWLPEQVLPVNVDTLVKV